MATIKLTGLGEAIWKALENILKTQWRKK